MSGRKKTAIYRVRFSRLLLEFLRSTSYEVCRYYQ